MPDQPFIFKISRKSITLTKSEIRQALKKFSKIKKSQSFNMEDFDAWKARPLSSASILHIYGSWSKAMKDVGLKARRTWKQSREELVETFKACWKQVGTAPSGIQLEQFLEKNNSEYRLSSYKFILEVSNDLPNELWSIKVEKFLTFNFMPN